MQDENTSKKFFDEGLFEDVKPSKIFLPGLMAALFYGLVSGSMSFINKVRYFKRKILVLDLLDP